VGARLDEEGRRQVRDQRKRQRRTVFYADRMAGSRTPTERLRHACEYLRAVAADLPDSDVNELARAVVALAEEGNTP